MRMKKWLLTGFLAAVLTNVMAQEKEYLYEIGAGGGVSWGYGDVNTSKAVYNPFFSYSLLYRYNLNLRWAFAAELQSAGIKGNTRDFDSAFPGGDYEFDRRYWQLQIRPEVHFWNYGLGSDYREKKRYTPFLTAGVSAGLVNGGDDETSFVFGIPFGAGYKFKMAKRWNAQVTCLFTKTFSDKLDGKTDPEGIRTDALIDNDWMASIQLSVTFDFKERCIECHNQKNQMRK